MVKGISRQVIVLHSPEQKLFEEAIFILKEDALRNGGISNDELLKEAKRLMNQQHSSPKRRLLSYGSVWACLGALVSSAVWAVCVLI